MMVALCGYVKVGKDSIAAHMPGYMRVAFADALKEFLLPIASRFNLSFDDPIQKAQIRPLMVELGRLGRSINPDFWIKQAYCPTRGNVVITDCRYVNEVRWVQDRGGIVVRVHRPGYGPANDEEHSTIMEIDQTCSKLRSVWNSGTVQEAANTVLGFVA